MRKIKTILLTKKIIILIIAVVSVGLFALFMFRNMSLNSKASASGLATLSLTSTATTSVGDGTVFTIGLLIKTNNASNKISGVDLRFLDKDDLFDYWMLSSADDSKKMNEFDEIALGQAPTRKDGTRKLERIVMVAKRKDESLQSFTSLRFTFKLRKGLAYVPISSTISIDTKNSMIVGPGINNNTYELTPSDVSVRIPLVPFGPTSYVAPSVTPTPIQQGTILPVGIVFKVKIPDVSRDIVTLPNVKVQLNDEGNVIGTKTISLTRVQQSDFFLTTAPVSFAVNTKKSYTLFIKQLKTVRRSFTLTLGQGDSLDCTADPVVVNCGSLAKSENSPLWLGDTDGFNDGTANTKKSGSYNKIDVADLQKLMSGYGKAAKPSELNGDFNQDGKINVADLAIMGKNFGKIGE